MLVSEVAPYLSYRIDRSLPARLVPLLGTNRLPMYRVKVPPDAKDLLVGQRLAGKYYVLSALGKGGMSVVYKAKVLASPRQRIVAVKTLRMQGLNDPLLVKRFQREAELLSHLNHPRIVQVHDYGYTSKGQPYFVMDYLVGDNLGTLILRDGFVSPRRARNIFDQVCGAVDHAHRCGVIHRDLKPHNIMLMTQEGDRDYVKVVDFGIARFEQEAQRLTRMGEVWGSPVYMSPEQCMGAQIDLRSDIYSFGIVMYEALTGNVPFLGRNYVETMSKQIGEPPPPFSTFASASAIPPALETIVMRALAKEPEKRYQSMGELRLDLESAFPEVVDQRRNQEKRANQRISRHRLRASESTVEAGTPPEQSRSSASTILLVLVGLLLAALIYAALKLLDTAKAPSNNGESLNQPAQVNNARESDSKDPDLPEEHTPGSPIPGGGVWESVPGQQTLPPDGTAKAPGAPDLPGDGSTKASSMSPEDTSSSSNN